MSNSYRIIVTAVFSVIVAVTAHGKVGWAPRSNASETAVAPHEQVPTMRGNVMKKREELMSKVAKTYPSSKDKVVPRRHKGTRKPIETERKSTDNTKLGPIVPEGRVEKLRSMLKNDPHFHGGAGASGAARENSGAAVKVPKLTGDKLVELSKDLPMMQLMIVNDYDGQKVNVNLGVPTAMLEYGVKGQEHGLDMIQRAVACDCEKAPYTVCVTEKERDDLVNQKHEVAWIINDMIFYDFTDEKLYWLIGPIFKIPKNATRPDSSKVAIRKNRIALPEALPLGRFNRQTRIHLAQRSQFLMANTFRIAASTPSTVVHKMDKKDEDLLDRLSQCQIHFN